MKLARCVREERRIEVVVIRLWVYKDKVREEEVVAYVVFAMTILALLLRLEYS